MEDCYKEGLLSTVLLLFILSKNSEALCHSIEEAQLS
jgi:hypothetical protein